MAAANTYPEELFAADVIGGRTFRHGPTCPEGIVPPGKKVFIASGRGGFYTGASPAAFVEHQESYLRGVLGFIGLTDVTVIRAEGVGSAASPGARAALLAEAKSSLDTLVA